MVWVLSLSDMDLSTHALTADEHFIAFGVWLGLVPLWAALAHPVLYPVRYSLEALPK